MKATDLKRHKDNPRAFGASKEEIEAALPKAHDAVMLTRERYMELLTAEAQLEALRIKVRKMQHE